MPTVNRAPIVRYGLTVFLLQRATVWPACITPRYRPTQLTGIATACAALCGPVPTLEHHTVPQLDFEALKRAHRAAQWNAHFIALRERASAAHDLVYWDESAQFDRHSWQALQAAQIKSGYHPIEPGAFEAPTGRISSLMAVWLSEAHLECMNPPKPEKPV